MIRKLTFTCIAVLCAFFAYAQPCNSPAPPGPDCGSASFFCNGEVDGFCSTLPPNGNPNGPSPLCNGNGVPNNTEWIAFAAGTTTINFTVTPSNCDQIPNPNGAPFSGVQAGIYSDCSFTNAITCQGACQTTAFTLGATNFVVGQVYYIFLDGCAGSVCDYSIDVTSGSTVSPPPGLANAPMGTATPCPEVNNGLNVFTVPTASFANLYYWNITPPSVVYSQSGNTISVTDWGGATSVTICVEAANDCNPGPNQANEVCSTFSINQIVPVDPPPGFYCENEPGYSYNGSLYQAAGSPWMVNLTSYQGCDSVVTLIVDEYLNTDSQLDTTICIGQAVVVDGQAYSNPVNGVGIPVSTPNFRGCDSTVFLTLEVLNPMVSISGNLNIPCGQTETILFANPTNNPNGSYVWSYQWDASGGSTSNGITDQNILLVDGPGVYSVEVTLTTPDGVFCSVTSAEVTVTASTDVPLTAMSATNAPCSGPPTGTATVTASAGGGGPYMYLWDPTAQTTPTATNLAAGWYFVTVTSASGCTAVDSIEVVSSAAVDLSIDNSVDVLCNGDATGSITVSGVGGTPGYTYLWNTAPVQTTPTASNLMAGTYTVVITDDAGCTDEETITITEPTALAFTSDAFPAACNGEASGQAFVTPAGGTPGYTYLWDSNAASQTTDTAFNLTVGFYSVTITDANNCTQEITNIEITEASAITITSSEVDVLCNGDATGSATANPNGGTPGYTYLWNTVPAQTNATATGLTAGFYSVTVTDANGCTEVLSGIEIEEADAMTGSALATDASCNGEASGSIVVTATGTGNLSYTWTANAGGATTATVNNLAAGTYSVTVTDGNNCTFVIDNIIIDEPTAVTATISASTNIGCFGDATGSATVTGGGGSGTYTYLWSANALSATTPTVNGLAAGTYDVTVTDGEGCTEVTSVTLTQPAAALDVMEVAVVDASCGANDGSIDISVSGGTTGYTFLWSPGGSTDEDPQNLAGGSYTVVVTDANNCTAELTATVNIPGGLSASATATPLNCFGDTDSNIDVTVTGGTMPFTYAWSDATFGNNEDIPNVGPGNYTVTISDGNNCSVQASVNITEPDSISINSAQVIEASCGLMDGSISLFVTGGTGTYSYAWTGGAAPVANPTNLSAGTYDVIITDINGCTKDTSIIVTSPNGPVLSTITATDVFCNGDSTGTINLDFTGGTAPYTYDWSGTDFDGIEDPTNVPAGTYDVTVTDANNCSFISSATVLEPDLLVTNVLTTDVECNGTNTGIAEVVITGGTGPFTFQWCTGQTTGPIVFDCPAGPCTVTVTDGNGCESISNFVINEPAVLSASIASVTPADCNGDSNGSIDLTVNGGVGPYTFNWTGGANPVINPTGLAAGSYDVTILDANGCEENLTGIVVQEPTVITVVGTTSNPDCNTNNGSISVTASGGNGGYTYAWTNGAAPVSNPSGLGAGTYDLIVTDSKGCTESYSVSLVTPNGPVFDDISAIDVLCNGESTGSVSTTISGGTAPYIYDWTGIAYDGMDNLTNVPAGLYEVTITDDNNCSAVSSVMVNEPPALSATTTKTDVLCNGTSTGTATAIPAGGTAGYTFLWCDGQTTDVATNLPQGVCTVVITDANNCSFTTSVTIDELPVLSATVIDAIPAVCNGEPSGSISLDVLGGTGAGTYTFAWTNGADPVINPQNLAAGFYDVIITDGNNCTQEITGIEITEPDPITFTSSSDDATCNQSNGSITIVPVGGNGTYSFLWSGGADPVANPQNLAAGDYDVTITDILGCTATGQVTVATPSALAVQVVQEVDANCFGEATGAITVNVTGGTPGYTYAWSGGLDPVANPTNVAAGTYTLDITDFDGCTISTSATVGQPTELLIAVDAVVAATCNQSNGSIDISVTGGITPYTFLWSNGDTNEDPGNLSPGLVDVVVTDGNGCTATVQVPVTEPGALSVMPTITPVTCNSATNGSITLNATGGNGPYTYVWNIPGAGNNNTVNNLAGGTYSAVVTDSDGCQFPLPTLLVDEPDVLVQDGIITGDASCLANDGSINISFTGGTGAYSYSWSSPTSAFTSTQEDLTGLAPGEYEVVVTDANNCSTIVQGIMIDVPNPPTVSADSIAVRCNGESNGQINLIVVGANGNVSYNWSDPTIGDVQNPTGLSAGMYTVTVTDSESCEAITSIEVTEPPVLDAVTLAPNDVACNGADNGSATVTATGGTPGYSYLWDNGAVVADPGGLAAGDYTVIVTDLNGCTAEAMTTITEPDALVLSSTATATRCSNESNGSIDLSSVGGVGNYMFDWDDDQYDGLEDLTDLPAGTYMVTVSDGNGCTEVLTETVDAPPAVIVRLESVSEYSGFNVSCANTADGSASVEGAGGNGGPFTYLWDNGETTGMVTDLAAGDYNVIVTDALGCTEDELITLTAPDSIEFLPQAQAVSCYGDDDGAIVIEDPVGGSGPFVYSLDNSTFGPGFFTGLSAGNYQIVVQDANGCEENAVVSVQEPTELVADLGADVEIQLGDSVFVQANTNSNNLDTLYWVTGADDLGCENCNGVWVTPTNTVKFSVFIEDESGCKDEDELTVRVKKDRLVYIPSGFSPGADNGNNNVFMIFGGQGVEKVNKFIVVGRWGEIVYSAQNFFPNDPNYGWDGTLGGEQLNPGVFVYMAEIEFTDGRIEIYKGDVTLLR